MLTNTYLKTLNWTKARVEDERGEMASWLVLSAALAAIALGLKGTLTDIMKELADKIDPG